MFSKKKPSPKPSAPKSPTVEMPVPVVSIAAQISEQVEKAASIFAAIISNIAKKYGFSAEFRIDESLVTISSDAEVSILNTKTLAQSKLSSLPVELQIVFLGKAIKVIEAYEAQCHSLASSAPHLVGEMDKLALQYGVK